MFIPKIYRSEDLSLMKKIISENAFAMLISGKGILAATHSMFLMNDDGAEWYLETHISRANPQAKVLQNGDEVLCDFLGAHSYISSSWYEKTNVSTWNYEAVQISGKIELMNDDELYSHLEKLTYKYEKPQKCPMFVEKMGNELVEKELKGAFGIKIWPGDIFISQKMSQNRNESDFENIIANLEKADDENSGKVAAVMRSLK